MPDTLRVHVNRQELHSLEVPDSFEAEGSFDVVLVNHGEAVHVHLHLDDGLAEIGTLEANNHYVQADSERPVRVTLDGTGGGDVFGKLKVVTSYGATTRYVDVDVIEPNADDEPVQVAESLSKPQPRQEPSSANREPLVASSADVLFPALVAIAGLLAITAMVLVDSLAVVLGAIAVLIALLVAAYVYLRG